MILNEEQASGLNCVIQDLHTALFALGSESSIAKDQYSAGDEFDESHYDYICGAITNSQELAGWFGDIKEAIEGERPSEG